MNQLETIKSWIHKDARIVFLGGAGVSTASGIPDFRSPTGLYKIQNKYGLPAERMLSHFYFFEHTDTFYDFYWNFMVFPNAKPNKAHIALANYEKRGGHIEILTQ
ncbi:MAG: NAD-dependent protein deacylase, partial [Mollicutes bacterium]|nr:NAD-dependent protein deacylase [Mollicutes bacterium]